MVRVVAFGGGAVTTLFDSTGENIEVEKYEVVALSAHGLAHFAVSHRTKGYMLPQGRGMFTSRVRLTSGVQAQEAAKINKSVYAIQARKRVIAIGGVWRSLPLNSADWLLSTLINMDREFEERRTTNEAWKLFTGNGVTDDEAFNDIMEKAKAHDDKISHERLLFKTEQMMTQDSEWGMF